MPYPVMTKELGTRLDESLDHVESCSRCKGTHDAPMCILATDHMIRLANYWRARVDGEE